MFIEGDTFDNAIHLWEAQCAMFVEAGLVFFAARVHYNGCQATR